MPLVFDRGYDRFLRALDAGDLGLVLAADQQACSQQQRGLDDDVRRAHSNLLGRRAGRVTGAVWGPGRGSRTALGKPSDGYFRLWTPSKATIGPWGGPRIHRGELRNERIGGEKIRIWIRIYCRCAAPTAPHVVAIVRPPNRRNDRARAPRCRGNVRLRSAAMIVAAMTGPTSVAINQRCDSAPDRSRPGAATARPASAGVRARARRARRCRGGARAAR